jgi:hypothetical protein
MHEHYIPYIINLVDYLSNYELTTKKQYEIIQTKTLHFLYLETNMIMISTIKDWNTIIEHRFCVFYIDNYEIVSDHFTIQDWNKYVRMYKFKYMKS